MKSDCSSEDKSSDCSSRSRSFLTGLSDRYFLTACLGLQANDIKGLLQTLGIKHGSIGGHMSKIQNAKTSDAWRVGFTERHILSWLESNEISIKVLKTDPTHTSCGFTSIPRQCL